MHLLVIIVTLFFCRSATALNNDTKWCSVDPSWTRPFLAALLADPQIGWNQDDYNSEELFREASHHVKRLQPDLILVAGDLIQTPGNEDQYEIAKEILDGIGIPYYVIAGNHDVHGTPRLDRMNEFLSWWNLPYYWYTVPHFNTLFVMIDSNILRKRDDSHVGSEIVELAWEELEWLHATLKTSEYKHIVPIAHHPMAIKRFNEDDKSQNTPVAVRDDLVRLYEEHPGKVSHVFAGHFHNSARIETHLIDYVTYPATVVILGSSPREPSGFALLQVEGDLLKENYYGYDDLPLSRPEASHPGFTITSPSNGESLIANTSVCLQWTSTSMAKLVLVEYSLDDSANWTVVGTAPNNGVHPWIVPFLGGKVHIKVSSVHDPTIYGISPDSHPISVGSDPETFAPTEAATQEPTKTSASHAHVSITIDPDDMP